MHEGEVFYAGGLSPRPCAVSFDCAVKDLLRWRPSDASFAAIRPLNHNVSSPEFVRFDGEQSVFVTGLGVFAY